MSAERLKVLLHSAFPDADDLEYHLTTLFPPVRPRGWLELRMIDALPEELWPAIADEICAITGGRQPRTG